MAFPVMPFCRRRSGEKKEAIPAQEFFSSFAHFGAIYTSRRTSPAIVHIRTVDYFPLTRSAYCNPR
jgi:hypothetical protein